MTVADDLISSFLEKGFRLDALDGTSRVLSSVGSGAVKHQIRLVFSKKWQSYSMLVSIFDERAIAKVRFALPMIRKFLPLNTADERHTALAKASCWTMFDVGRAMNWELLRIPQWGKEYRWREDLKDAIDNFLHPCFWSITESGQIVNTLLRTERPFEWNIGSPVMRMAEIIALDQVNKVNSADTKKKLMSKSLSVAPLTYKGYEFEQIVEELISYIKMT